MWGLLGWLLAKGQIAQVNTLYDTDFIGIYPEIVHGNPLKAKKVVRYILQKPGLATMYGQPGPTKFDPTDILIYFSRVYAPDDVKDEDILFLPICNLHIFKDYGRKRDKTCYLVGKGLNTNIHPKDSILIDRTFANDQKKLADLLNECHTMYSYDPVTAMFEVARLCGTKVITTPTRYPVFDVDLTKYEPGLNGINSELDTQAFRKHYIGMIKTFEERLDKFIERMEND